MGRCWWCWWCWLWPSGWFWAPWACSRAHRSGRSGCALPIWPSRWNWWNWWPLFTANAAKGRICSVGRTAAASRLDFKVAGNKFTLGGYPACTPPTSDDVILVPDFFQYHAQSMHTEVPSNKISKLPHPPTQALPNHKSQDVPGLCSRSLRSRFPRSSWSIVPDDQQIRTRNASRAARTTSTVVCWTRARRSKGRHENSNDSNVWGLNSLLYWGVETIVELGDVRELWMNYGWWWVMHEKLTINGWQQCMKRSETEEWCFFLSGSSFCIFIQTLFRRYFASSHYPSLRLGTLAILIQSLLPNPPTYSIPVYIYIYLCIPTCLK